MSDLYPLLLFVQKFEFLSLTQQVFSVSNLKLLQGIMLDDHLSEIMIWQQLFVIFIKKLLSVLCILFA